MYKINGQDVFEEIKNELENGIFWIDWDNCIKYFSYIYLNWNPAIYPYRKIINSLWIRGNLESLFWNEQFCVENNPQFLFKIPPHEDDFEVHFTFFNINIC